MRVDECRSAAYALKAYAGMEYGKFGETNLRDVPVEVFHRFADRLPETWRRRAEHWYGEYDRVQRGAEAWRSGNLEEFGRLSFESGKSSIEKWETGSPELKKIYEIMTQTEAHLRRTFQRSRIQGMLHGDHRPGVPGRHIQKVETEYLAAFPELKGHYSACICHSADGVKI